MSGSRDLGPIFEELFSALVERIAAEVADRLRETPAPARRLLSVEDAARYLNRTANAVRCMEKSGKLPVVRVDGRVQFDVQDLCKLIDQNKTTTK